MSLGAKYIEYTANSLKVKTMNMIKSAIEN